MFNPNRFGTAWRPDLESIRREARPMLALAWPVVLAELAWMGMDLVDTIMVGNLGPAALGAVGLGGILYFVVGVFAIGLLLGLDTLVSQSFGAGDREEGYKSLVQGVYLALLTSPPMMVVLWAMIPWLSSWGIHPDIARLTGPFLALETWSLFPLLLYCALRRYLQAVNVVRPILWAMISANLLNWLGNCILINGHLGLPALGVRGSAGSTLIARIYMALYLVVIVLRHEPGLLRTSLAPDWARLRRLFALGLPVAVQITLEVGVFAIAAGLAGAIGPAALAAHQVTLKMCSVTFMVPLGISSAAAVRVGQAVGRGDPRSAAVSGWTALMIGSAFMSVAALTFLLVPRTILGGFTTDAGVIRTGVGLLVLAAAFQLFDGLQVVASGNLRGLGDTRTPMLCNTLAHWALGLPLAYGLGVLLGLGVFGIWVGLCVGLIAAGLILLAVWAARAPSRGHHVDLDPDRRPSELATA
jgi:MATE family multidrug resistance protein